MRSHTFESGETQAPKNILDPFLFSKVDFCLRKSRLYNKVYFMGINTMFGHVMPFMLTFVFNILVLRILKNVQSEQSVISLNR